MKQRKNLNFPKEVNSSQLFLRLLLSLFLILFSSCKPTILTIKNPSSVTNGGSSENLSTLLNAPVMVEPTTPTGFRATSLNETVQLNWDASTGTDPITYTLIRTLSASGDPTPVVFTGLTSSSYTDTSVTAGTTYYYVVYASNPIGDSPHAAQIDITPLPSFSISSMIQNNAIGSNTLFITWPNVAGATNYNVYQSTTGTDPGTLIITGTAATSTTVSSLTPGTTYSFKIVAKNTKGDSSSTTAYASGTPLGAFSLSAPINTAVGSIELNWSPSLGASSYQVKYGTSTGSYPHTTSSTVSTSQTINGLTEGTPYYFQITASNGFGNFASSLDATAEATQITLQTFTYHWNFTPSSNYSLSSSTSLDITNGMIELTPADQLDNTTAQFNLGNASSEILVGSNQVSLNTATPNSGSFGSHWTPKYSNLIGYWPLDSISGGNTLLGTTANGSPLNGNLQGTGTGITSIPGVVNNGIQLSGTADVFSFSTPNLFATGAYSVSFWFKTTSNGNPFVIVDNPYTINYADQNINIQSGNICFFPAGESICSVGGSYADGNWHHVVAVMPGTGGTSSVYVDGQQVATGTNPIPGGYSAGGFRLGDNTAQGYSNGPFTGSLDELAIWNTGLLPTDVAALYSRQRNQKYQGLFTSRVMDSGLASPTWSSLNWFSSLPFGKPLIPSGGEIGYGFPVTDFSTNLVAYWKLNETSGTSFADATGRGHTGTSVGSIGLGSRGILNQAAYFNGSSSIQVPHSTDLSLIGTSFSLAGWFYVPAGGGSMYLLSKKSAPFEWRIESGFPLLGLGNGGQSSVYQGTSTVPLDQWFHLAATVEPHPTISWAILVNLYLNGNNIGSDLYPYQFIPLVDGGNFLTIGREEGVSNRFFTGFMEEIAIWNGRTLSSSEVTELYRRGANRIKMQIRSCSTNHCADDPSNAQWQGPDGSSYTYFSEASSTNTTAPLQNFSGTPGRQYIQYRAILESDDSALVPNLQSVHFNPDHYKNNQPTVTSINTGPAFVQLTGFSEILGADGCPGGIKYQLSLDGVNWKHWSGSAWATASSYATSNSASTIHSNIGTFSSQVGTGTLYIRAYLNSDGTQACQIDQISVTGAN